MAILFIRHLHTWTIAHKGRHACRDSKMRRYKQYFYRLCFVRCLTYSRKSKVRHVSRHVCSSPNDIEHSVMVFSRLRMTARTRHGVCGIGRLGIDSHMCHYLMAFHFLRSNGYRSNFSQASDYWKKSSLLSN